uniref:Glycine cleavage H-protein n=1 Tax=Marseillevirus LCMAC101 TaxID=2506602 RepID=A0A481YRT4_9VIRU|nr:MAG: glycine cleavage H-protein [Marseillevirus LCMAC101]
MKSHEYVIVENDEGTCGITKYAADKIGDIAFVSLPTKGESIENGVKVAEIESVKSCEEIKSPVSGTITDVNNPLEEEYHLISEYPEERGWIWKMNLNNKEELKDLMDEDRYKEYLSTLE